MPLTLTEAGQALQDLAGSLSKDVFIPALQPFVQPVQSEVRAGFTATTLAQKIAKQMTIGGGDARNRTKARPLVGKGLYTSVYTREEYANAPALRVVTYGLSAMMEVGGRTKPHEILPHAVAGANLGKKSAAKFGRSAALKLPDGFAGRVKHPGSNIAALHIIETVLRRIEGPVKDSIERALVARRNALKLG